MGKYRLLADPCRLLSAQPGPTLAAAATSLFATPDPFEYLPEQMPNRDRRFLALMEAAGYRLAAIDTDEGLFGRVRYHFEQQRALSPGDLKRIRRGLVEHRAILGPIPEQPPGHGRAALSPSWPS